MVVKYRPRNDIVVIRQIDHGKTKSGIAISQISIQAKEFFVEAVEIMLVVDERGQYFALDVTVNQNNPNGIER